MILQRIFQVSDNNRRNPILDGMYQRYLDKEDSAAFIRAVSHWYTVPTLERLAESGHPEARRAAVLALGFLADYESNAFVGRALCDEDRTVRLLAENAIRQIWCRAGSEDQRQKLGLITRLSASQQYSDAIRTATEMLAETPWFAEVWNQRGMANYHLKQFAEAIGDCHQALELNPYHFPAATAMGQCYLELGDRAAALESLRRSLKLNPGLEGVRAQIAYLQRQMEEH